MLAKMLEEDKSFADLFDHGKKYLPLIKSKQTGKLDLDRLHGYIPEIVEYFDVLAELPSLPDTLKDLATDLAIYANGETVQTDAYYQRMDYEHEIETALKGTSRPK
jgi:hypothetical protein